MTILEQVLNAASTTTTDTPLSYPLTLTSNSILPNLKPLSENPFPSLQPLSGFNHLSQIDSSLIELNADFFNKFSKKLKSPKTTSTSSSFIELIIAFLKKIEQKKFGESLVKESESEGYACKLVEKYGGFVGRDVMGKVIEGCIEFQIWGILKTLILGRAIVDHALRSEVVNRLVVKGRCDLLCLCLRWFDDLEAGDLGKVLKCFLSTTSLKEGCLSMVGVKEEWDKEANAAVEKISADKGKKTFAAAKDAALLLMVAVDQFMPYELCLHFVVSPINVDEVVFSSAVSKLSGAEMMRFVRYLRKWIGKYERFPQVVPCGKAAGKLGLSLCQWVPRFEVVVKALGLVVDEHFSSLALHSEFHEELVAVQAVVSSLVSEGRLCCSLANLIEILKPEIRGA